MVLANDAVAKGMADAVGTFARAIASRATAAKPETDQRAMVEDAAEPFVGIEVPERAVDLYAGRSSYVREAQDAFWSAALDLNLGVRPKVRFFRPETAEDRADLWSERILWPIRVDGLSQLDRGLLWVSVMLTRGGC